MVLEYNLGYYFKDKVILNESLTHPSLNNQKNKSKNYERLELLGDAILSFVIIDILLKEFPKMQEGEIVKMKSILVSKDILSKIALEIGLNEYMLLSKGEEGTGGRNNVNNLANVLEAIIGAIYLDSDVLHVYQFIKKFWMQDIQNIDIIAGDPKTFLQEWSQSMNYDVPKYHLIHIEGSKHSPSFTVEVTIRDLVARSNGNSIKTAEKNAAKFFITSFVKNYNKTNNSSKNI